MHRQYFLVALAICFVGCTSSDEQPSRAELMESLRINNNAGRIAFDHVPDDFETVSPNLLKKKLAKPTSGQQRFEIMPDTGILFQNDLARDKPYRFIETGAGLATGDFDNDGIIDVYFCGTDVPNKLYRGLGDFKFEDVTFEAGVNGLVNGQPTWCSGATFADVDNDGDLDLFVANLRAPSLLYINQGDGTFDEQSIPRNVNYLGAGKIGNFCDYDRDGDLDLYLLTYQDSPPATPAIRILDGKKLLVPGMEEYRDLIGENELFAGEQDILYRNDGNGVFVDVTRAAGIAGFDPGLSCTWLDVDDDGWMDLYVGSDFKKPDHLYRNNGDGTFNDVIGQYVNHTPWFSMGADAGDLNNDGLVDFLIADMSGSTHYKQKLNMGGMNEVGWFLEYGHPRQYMKNSLYLNSGAGQFFEAASMTGLSATDWTWAPRLIDLDNDGMLDVYVTNGHARDAMNADIATQFTAAGERSATSDEKDKLYAKVPKLNEHNLAFKNKGNLEFEPVGKDWNLDHKGVSHGASFADIDQDGDLDLLVNNYYERALIYRNNSDQGHRMMFEFRAETNNRFGYGAKVEVWAADHYASKRLTPTRGYVSTDAPQLHFGLGEHDSADRVRITWPDMTYQEFTNVGSDCLYRIIESKERKTKAPTQPPNTLFAESAIQTSIDFEHRDTKFGDYEREPLLPYSLSELGCQTIIGDVNGDGFPDVYCGGAAGQSSQLYLNRAGKSFVKTDGPWAKHADSEDTASLFFDADGDGDLDLYVASGSNECNDQAEVLKDRLYLNAGDGNFSIAAADAIPDLRDSGAVVAAADFDGDSDMDLFVGSRSIPGQYPRTPTSRLLINQDGKFVEASKETCPGLNQAGLINSATWADYDQDGDPDLVLALDWGPITLFKNDDGKLRNATQESGVANYQGWWHGVTAADLDGDGDMDLVATNQGLNTKYHANAKHPHRIYFDDFDKNGTLDLVEAEFEGDTEYPVRGRSCSSNTMPFIAEKFGTYHEFAQASLLDIYEPEISNRPRREVNYLESAIFWNEGQTFRIEPLPRLAQISPGYGVTAADFDGDSKLDLLMATNFFSSQPETGYMDGGLGWFLKGDGKGKFSPVWPNRSGVVLPVDANSVSAFDMDGDGDLDAIIGVTNGRTRLLKNQTK